jgi:hypothetical protein
MNRLSLLATLALGVLANLPTTVAAQPGANAGVDVSLGILGPQLATAGRSGTVGTGFVGMAMATTSCNPGTINVPWLQYMDSRHPCIGFMVVREQNGRLYQVSDRSYVKHGFFALSNSQCTPCTYASNGTWLGIGCSDTYATGNNGNNFDLAPPDEIDPWSGVWTVRCSLFDRGFPAVPAPADCDGVESARNPPAGPGWRVKINDADMVGGGIYYYCAHYVIMSWTQASVGPSGSPVPQPAGNPTGPLGEPDGNRDNNMGSRAMTVGFSTTTGAATFATSGTQLQGTVLQRWTGAAIQSSSNGVADGRVYVASKVTGPVDGIYHYEFAAHNRDNAGGISAFRVPVCPNARVVNAGFHDTDVPLNAANDWTFTRAGNEIAWTAPAGNALRWNGLFNFWFDSDAAPAPSSAILDEATLLRGAAPTFTVGIQAPLGNYNVNTGAGCGSPAAPTLFATGTPPRATLGNAGFGLASSGNAPGATGVLLASLFSSTLPVPPCSLYLGIDLFVLTSANANAAGVVSYALPIPNDGLLEGTNFHVQHLEAEIGGQLLGFADASNGLTVRIGSAIPGCQ